MGDPDAQQVVDSINPPLIIKKRSKSFVQWRSIRKSAGHLVSQFVTNPNFNSNPVESKPLGNQELWKFVHSVYGGDLGFSSNEESGQTPSIDASGSRAAEEGGILPVLALPPVGIGGGSGGGGPGSNSHSPSPSLFLARTSNDDELYFQLHHHRDFTSSRVQVI